jgi:hypothetical protein
MSNSIEPTVWQNSIPTLTPTEKYLWAQFTKTEGFSSSVWTGVVGIYGDTGPVGDDYVLTDADKAEIAEMAADLVEVPEPSGGKADFVVQDIPPEDTSVLWVDTDDNNDDGFQEAVNVALAQAKESGEFDGNDYVLTPDDKTEIAKMAAELVDIPESSGGITVTGAKVGQTVTIAEVDDNGVPTAWEAVDFPSEGEYELIETVTLQEDIAYVYLTTYPDGNDYALKALFVRVTTPGDDAQRAGYIFAYGDTNRRIKLGGGYVPRMVNTTARVTTFACRVSHGRWESILYGSAEGETNSDTPTNYPRMQGLYSVEQYPVIACVEVYCKERTSAGTVVEIWGVRA